VLLKQPISEVNTPREDIGEDGRQITLGTSILSNVQDPNESYMKGSVNTFPGRRRVYNFKIKGN